MTDSLPVHKHVVPDVDGASRERNPAFCEAQVTQLGLAGQHKERRQGNHLALHRGEGVTVPDGTEGASPSIRSSRA